MQLNCSWNISLISFRGIMLKRVRASEARLLSKVSFCMVRLYCYLKLPSGPCCFLLQLACCSSTSVGSRHLVVATWQTAALLPQLQASISVNEWFNTGWYNAPQHPLFSLHRKYIYFLGWSASLTNITRLQKFWFNENHSRYQWRHFMQKLEQRSDQPISRCRATVYDSVLHDNAK